MRIIEKTSQFFLSFDWVLALLTVALVAVGLASIYSIDLSRSETLNFFPTQLTALILGLGVLVVASLLHVTIYQSTARLWYGFAVFLLVAVLFFGVSVRGTTGWFRILGFSFQPAEFAKVAMILWFGWWIARQGRQFHRWQYVISSGVIAAIPVGLILLQPDLGSASMIIGVWFGILLLTGTKKRYILGLIFAAFIVFAMGWLFLFADYQKERLVTFMNPDADPLGSGYNVAQSMIAIGSGGVTGQGLGFGSQSQLRFLPEAQTDFIFSVIAEELGFIGVSIVIVLFALLLIRLVYLAKKCNSDFETYTILGIVLLFFIQIVVNIGAAIGLLPVTGLTLPFISYGGSSLIMNFLLIGIAQSIARSVRAPDTLEHA